MRFEVRFTGRVQGVGFRYTTARLARRHEVRGWVRNEPDGAVLCVVEGETAELRRFVTSVQEAMEPNIRTTDIRETPATGAFEDFSIRR